MDFEAIIFANRAAFDGAMVGKLTSYEAKGGEATTLANGIDSIDDNKVMLPLNNTIIRSLSWNPHQIVIINTNDPKWFNNIIL